MTRTDNDTWDLASSVGATATLVAAARAAASRETEPLIDDPFAEPLVRAVGIEFFTKMASGALPAPDEQTAMGVTRMTDNMAVRTKFFDEFFVDAAEAGIRQVVILASGLDSRAYRLDWPADMVVFEIDQPEVIAFKTQALAAQGAAPTCDRRTVAMDLRFDWATALREAGFDPQAPTAWSAEGLLGYLPPEAQDRLLDTVTELSAPGSRIAIDTAPPSNPAEQEESRERMQEISEQWSKNGFDLDFGSLVYLGERNEASEYLTGHGWQVDTAGVNDLLAAGQRGTFDDDEPMGKLYYLSAVYGGAR
ncbi:class I SAM-dependent methyltransferase [Mycobacterium sp. CVI_P3]|uniref:S-adenosyl-L-methionine-dependent methyltransferase n=1 Tax=Mycobacterium pinniadriaticum TaxID=2994102 RepID=A0ABT3SNJ2_9MYCO|nr:class I SAM-dependent methyltransferase [Mycobacterium pinniadriaticum]MCX2934682.1 class I SAM-dependent methyltransferase [Mycobacterium pinniadriaticum]MCX2941104.1 class I SAM-dependent methyltransferase [Mycobacterium pinniadriaticum]